MILLLSGSPFPFTSYNIIPTNMALPKVWSRNVMTRIMIFSTISRSFSLASNLSRESFLSQSWLLSSKVILQMSKEAITFLQWFLYLSMVCLRVEWCQVTSLSWSLCFLEEKREMYICFQYCIVSVTIFFTFGRLIPFYLVFFIYQQTEKYIRKYGKRFLYLGLSKL